MRETTGSGLGRASKVAPTLRSAAVVPDRSLGRGELPLPLAAIPDPPARLFCRGRAEALGAPAVAIVGSRRCTRQGAEFAFALSRDLATLGLNVVSGLAYGIDAAAHRGALAARLEDLTAGVTIAVLGGGLRQLYPRVHERLAADIVASGGALITEHAPDQPPRKHHFPARNRIISGVSLGVVIVEASEKSGSLITARMALEQGREVMAVPSLVSSPLGRGCHRLIREGAALVECADHVVEALGLPLPAAAPAARSENSVLASVEATPTSVEAVVATTGLPLEDVLRQLTELEIDGAVASHNGGYIRLP